MGYDASSYTVVGLRIAPASRFYKRTLVKVGDHDIPPDEAMFDAKTGKPLYEEEDLPLFGDDNYDDRPKLSGGIHVHTRDAEGPNSPFLIVGRAVGADPGNDSWSGNRGRKRVAARVPLPEEVEEIRQAIRDQLPEHLWAEDQFGLWSVVYHSY